MARRLFCLAWSLIGLGCTTLSAQESAAKARASIVAPFLDDLTFSVARIDFSRLAPETLIPHLEKLGVDGKIVENLQILLPSYLGEFERLKINEIYFVRSVAFPSLTDELGIIPLGPGNDGAALKAILEDHVDVYTVLRDNVLLIGSKKVLAKAQDIKPTPRPELTAGFGAARPAAIQIVFMPPPLVRRSVLELMPNLPKEWGGNSSASLSRAFQWGLTELDWTARLELRFMIQSPDNSSARELATFLEGLLRHAKKTGALTDWDARPELLDILSAKVTGNRLSLTLDEKSLRTLLPRIGFAGLRPLPTKKKKPTESDLTENILKNLGFAMHSYHDVKKALPPHAIYGKDGKPQLSWRVMILPYIEQEALYKQFRLNEPWDSPHNKKLIGQMPEIYRSPFQKNAVAGHTVYLAPVGKGTIFEGPKGIKLSHITDGTSNTILLVEVAQEHAVIWTKPDDFHITTKDPISVLTGKNAKQIFAVFGDGSTRRLPRTVRPEILRALLTRNGAEVVEESEIE